MEPQTNSVTELPTVTAPMQAPETLPPPIDGGGPPTSTPSPIVVAPHCLPCTDLAQMQNPVIEFGSRGGVPPRSVQIFADGKLVASGVTTHVQALSPLTVKALIQLLNAEQFWILPEFTSKATLPDIATQFVKVNLPCTNREVAVRGSDTDGPFAELYTLLTELVGFSW